MAEKVKSRGIIIGLVIAGALIYALTKPVRAAPLPGLANLYGRITDSETGNPIAGALVTLNGMSVYTDSGGNYAFIDLELGSYSGSASKAGYETGYF